MLGRIVEHFADVVLQPLRLEDGAVDDINFLFELTDVLLDQYFFDWQLDLAFSWRHRRFCLFLSSDDYFEALIVDILNALKNTVRYWYLEVLRLQLEITQFFLLVLNFSLLLLD